MEKWTRIRFMPNLPLGEEGQRVTACDAHIALSKNTAKEGMVLLKNEKGLLPLDPTAKLALFGKGTFDYVKGGGGSGDVTTPYIVNLYEGLQKLGVCVEEDLARFYGDYVKKQYAEGKAPGMIPEAEVPQALMAQARAFTDTAVISISRFSGEGWDRGGEEGKEVFQRGDFYLSDEENALVNAVTDLFPKVVVVLNVGGMVDSQWFAANTKIHSVLMAWQGGMEGGTAAAELLFGMGNPSGKLSDTFAMELEDYPSTANFHESQDYVDYTEDIYVGYRYFETLPGAAQRVNYPFGFGLSYTTFSWEELDTKLSDDLITVTASVKNTGAYAGKEVLQLYAQAPQGKLGKAERSLVAFQKTGLLQPGASQTLTLSFSLAAMASYDDLGKVAKSAYVLEKGDYRFHLGTSVRDTRQLAFTYTVDADTVTQQLSQKIAPRALKHRLTAGGSYEALPQLPEIDMDATGLPQQPQKQKLSATPATRVIHTGKPAGNFKDVAEGKITLDEFVDQIPTEHLLHLLGGQPCLGVANTCGFGNIPEFQVPSAMTADGPAGVRLLEEVCVRTTAFPCSTLLACTWDPEITYAIGQAGAKEIRENNLACWLTPAVNIHRSPLCGRNFEYYSEDPFLAGTMAAGMVKGIQSQKVAPSLKHFALNNKETNRRNCDSRVSERAAREIYLKAFEIIVKTADPWYIMSAYNPINGCRASENRELLEDILRGEWGFDGMVSTDWSTLGEHYKEVKAGNDLKMPGGFPQRLQEALDAELITPNEIKVSAKRILSVILRLA